MHAIDLGGFFRVPADNRDLNYEQFFEYGKGIPADISEFTSDNTKLLSKEEVKKKLLLLEYVQEELKNRNI